MKTSKLLLLASLAAAASFAAQADEADASQYGVQFQGALSRAQVQAELGQYKKAGVNPWSTSYNQIAASKAIRTRADVSAEYLAARDQVAALNGEDSGSAYLTQTAVRGTAASTNLAGQPRNSAR
ncbi:DUF4148 domain-containing protein [Ramlibacter sp.]|uniref:DUF4148 domain-containing protein n=1 Tax=Ramlibacter sp. TaxID=1917967 RepID=UPI002C5EBE47|nr:DUF4148 domain-containing protein [Ramlibacter sp.]HWI81060.1 DUF4148 domain-containing protein [Ramlibacter sp.]